jgi:hypothetical protein
MEDLDIIRHDMQPGLQPGRRLGCRARSTAKVGLPAKVGLAIFRESRPRTEYRDSLCTRYNSVLIGVTIFNQVLKKKLNLILYDTL